MRTARDDSYQMKSADRRDRATLRRLRETVLSKAKLRGLDEAMRNETLLGWLWELAQHETGMEIITANTASSFEVVHELMADISDVFSEEIEKLQAIILAGTLRWIGRGIRAPAQWSMMVERTFVGVWLGGRPQPKV